MPTPKCMTGTPVFATSAEDVPHVRLDVLDVVLGREVPDPRVEELHRLRPRLDLRPQVPPHDLRQLLHQRVEVGRRSVHELLGLREVGALAALDEVARQRERRPREADERDLQLAAEQADGGHHVPEPSSGSMTRRRSMSARVRTGSCTTGPSPLANSKGAPIGSSGSRMSAKRMAASTPWTSGWSVTFSAELRGPAQLEERVLLAELAVLGHVRARPAA